ncbi:MAG: GntR family transcriptional regulator [Oscillospiraceae bacterium]
MDNLLPKYYIIKKDLITKIDGEELTTDEAIPSERELMEIYNVSRITVRRAVDELSSEGYLYKIQGKGTFVKGNTRTTGLSYVTSCTKEIAQQGFTPSRKIISINIENSSKKQARIMGIEHGEKVLHIERLYYADGVPVNYCNNYLVYKYFEGIEEYDLNNYSIYDLIENHYGMHIEDSTRYIEAVAAYEDVAKWLEVPEGFPLMHFHGITKANQNNKTFVVETFNTSYNTQKIRFYIDQKSK